MQQLLKITPDKTIEFPSTLYVSQTIFLRLHNYSETFVAFKIKTTAPKSYLVRPSTGVISASEHLDVEIILQPLTDEPSACSPDRFLIQSTVVPNGEVLPRDYWVTLDKASVHDQRLNVVFKKVIDSQQPQNSSGTAAGGGGQLEGGGGFAASSAGDGTAAAGSNMGGVMNTKYNEVVDYCLALEKQKVTLQKENEGLKAKLQARENAGQGGGGGVRTGGMELWHWFALIIIAMVMLKVMGYI